MGFLPNTSLTVETIPDEAIVFINDDSIGVTPIKNLPLRAGIISLEIRKNDFFSIDTSVILEAEGSENFKFKLIPAALVFLEIIPKDAEVRINDKITTTVAQSYLRLPVGQHTIHVSHQDYEDINGVFNLSQGVNQKLKYILSKKDIITAASPPMLSINSIPSGAIIYQNDIYVGTTPYKDKMVSPGSYEFSIKKEGFKEFKKNITTKEFEPLTITASLEKMMGSLYVITNPADATLTLDGQEITYTKTPLSLKNLPVGTHEIILNKEGFASLKKNVDIKSEEITNVNLDLIALYGDFNLQVKPWGTIFINGSLRQKETNLIYSERLTCQEHLIKVEHPTLGTWEKVVQILPERSTQIEVDFNKLFNLSITAFDQDGKPVWANIFIDDQNTNEITPKKLKLNLGLHKISVQKQGYILTSGEKTVMLEENQNEPIKFILMKNIN